MSNSVRSIRVQIAAGVEVQRAENASAIFDLAHSEVCNGVKLFLDARREWLSWFFLTNVDGIFAGVRLIAGPEVELVFGMVRALVIDEWGTGNARSCFRKVKGDFSNQSI